MATHAFPCLPCLHARGASLTLPPKAPERLGLAALARPPVLTTQCHPLSPPATVVRQQKQTKHADDARPRGPHVRSASGACQGLQPLLHDALGRYIHAPLRRLGRAVRGAAQPPHTAFFAYAHARAPAFFADVGRLPAALGGRPRVQGDEGSQDSRVGRRQRRWLVRELQRRVDRRVRLGRRCAPT